RPRSLHDALPICPHRRHGRRRAVGGGCSRRLALLCGKPRSGTSRRRTSCGRAGGSCWPSRRLLAVWTGGGARRVAGLVRPVDPCPPFGRREVRLAVQTGPRVLPVPIHPAVAVAARVMDGLAVVDGFDRFAGAVEG